MYLHVTCVIALLCASVIGKNIINYEEDDGPLILTPLIERNQTEEARKYSKVDPTVFGGVKSYAAYITVNKTYNSNIFFWYFPAANSAAAAEDTPWLIWLQGGPGSSSMFGLLYEIGPLQIVDGNAQKMNVTWGSDYSLLFIENPVGTGFSFTDEGGYATDQEMVGSALLNFLHQFLQVFPELKKAPLFITGESYAGKYIPAFGHYILHDQNDAYPINLKGLAIGDGWTDPISLIHYSEFALQVGLVSPEQAKEIAHHEDEARKSFDNGDFKKFVEEAQTATNLLYNYAPVDVYNYLEEKRDESATDSIVDKFFNRQDVQKALHVGHFNYSSSSKEAWDNLYDDIYKSVKPWLEELIDHYGVMCYNGQLDLIVAYALSVHTYHSLKWSAVDEYLKNERQPLWDVNDKNKVIAFVKQGGNFMDVMVRGAGHMVPQDKPEAAKQLIDYFIKHTLNK